LGEKGPRDRLLTRLAQRQVGIDALSLVAGEAQGLAVHLHELAVEAQVILSVEEVAAEIAVVPVPLTRDGRTERAPLDRAVGRDRQADAEAPEFRPSISDTKESRDETTLNASAAAVSADAINAMNAPAMAGAVVAVRNMSPVPCSVSAFRKLI
jgi:hypothetical protein